MEFRGTFFKFFKGPHNGDYSIWGLYWPPSREATYIYIYMFIVFHFIFHLLLHLILRFFIIRILANVISTTIDTTKKEQTKLVQDRVS